MGKNNKKPAQAPAQKETKTTQTPPPAPKKDAKEIKVVDITGMEEALKSAPTQTGLDPNHQVDLLNLLDRRFFQDKDAAQRYKMNPDTVEHINHFVAIGAIAVMANEVTLAKNPFAIRMRTTQLEAIAEISSEVGVTIDAKLLPAPKDGVVEVPSTAIKVDEESQEQIKKEAAATAAEPSFNPTEIKSKEELQTSLLAMLADNKTSTFEKFVRVVAFYRAYLKIQAKDDKEAIETIENKSDVQILEEVTEVVGKCPFVLNGFGNYMHTLTSAYHNPAAAFCLFRNTARNKTTDEISVPDQEIANIVRVLVTWTATTKIKEVMQRIVTTEDDIKVLSKDEKKNAKAIEEAKAKIETLKANVDHFNEIIECTHNPSSELADNFLENFRSEDSREYKKLFGFVTSTFYKDVDLKTMKTEQVLGNVVQYLGIITNLFRNSGEQLQNYNESNIVELTPVETSEENEKSKKD